MMKDISGRVISLVQALREHISTTTMIRLSPLVLHCIYNCATNLSWMSLETNNPQYATGKRICQDILRVINIRWKVAGKYSPYCFIDDLLTLVPGRCVYLELIQASDLAQNESS
jgi:hypothetical protein